MRCAQSRPQNSHACIDKALELRVFENLAKKAVSEIFGISAEDAALLKRIFGIDTIKEITDNKYVLIA